MAGCLRDLHTSRRGSVAAALEDGSDLAVPTLAASSPTWMMVWDHPYFPRVSSSHRGPRGTNATLDKWPPPHSDQRLTVSPHISELQVGTREWQRPVVKTARVLKDFPSSAQVPFPRERSLCPVACLRSLPPRQFGSRSAFPKGGWAVSAQSTQCVSGMCVHICVLR